MLLLYIKLFQKRTRYVELVSSSSFLHFFFEKNISRYINWLNFIVWMPLLLEIMGKMGTVTIFFPICDLIDFEINLSLSLSRFPTWPKKSGQKFRYVENDDGFLDEIKNTFHHLENTFIEANKSNFFGRRESHFKYSSKDL